MSGTMGCIITVLTLFNSQDMRGRENLAMLCCGARKGKQFTVNQNVTKLEKSKSDKTPDSKCDKTQKLKKKEKKTKNLKM